MMTQEEIERLQREAEDEFMKYPGVIGVGYGFKRAAGQTTEVLSFRVYVVEKKELAELKPEEIIPQEFKGVATDVMTVTKVSLLECEDKDYHSPLIGGITVSNQKLFPPGHPNAGKPPVGTLGFFATINGQKGPENVVLVSNNHVLMDNGAQVNDKVYQPEFVLQNGQVLINLSRDKIHKVGKIHRAGLIGEHPFQYPGETSLPYGIDCATAELDMSISSWCNTNCGIHFKNEIRGLNIGGKNNIANVARVKQIDLQTGTPYIVYKVGRTTSRTVGKVTATDHIVNLGPPTLPANITLRNCIEIEATENNCNGQLMFADHGDSGAALINARNELIGIVFAGATSDPKLADACHIHPVLDKLGVTPITTANPHTAADTFFDVPGVITEGGFNHTPLLREKFLSTERGREFFELIKKHRMEAVNLVNHRRPVTVAWHRSNGPAFLSHLINNARDPEHTVPREIEGVDRETLIQNMARAFLTHGSTELKSAVERHVRDVLNRINQFDNLHELVKQLS